MEKTGHNSLFIQFQIRQDNGYTQGMYDIGFS